MNTRHMKFNNCLYVKVDLNDPNRGEQGTRWQDQLTEIGKFWEPCPSRVQRPCMQTDTKVCFALQNVDVTRVTMVPYQLETPWTVVPNESSSRDEHLLLVTE